MGKWDSALQGHRDTGTVRHRDSETQENRAKDMKLNIYEIVKNFKIKKNV